MAAKNKVSRLYYSKQNKKLLDQAIIACGGSKAVFVEEFLKIMITEITSSGLNLSSALNRAEWYFGHHMQKFKDVTSMDIRARIDQAALQQKSKNIINTDTRQHKLQPFEMKHDCGGDHNPRIFTWSPRVPNPRTCPRCKAYLTQADLDTSEFREQQTAPETKSFPPALLVKDENAKTILHIIDDARNSIKDGEDVLDKIYPSVHSSLGMTKNTLRSYIVGSGVYKDISKKYFNKILIASREGIFFRVAPIHEVGVVADINNLSIKEQNAKFIRGVLLDNRNSIKDGEKVLNKIHPAIRKSLKMRKFTVKSYITGRYTYSDVKKYFDDIVTLSEEGDIIYKDNVFDKSIKRTLDEAKPVLTTIKEVPISQENKPDKPPVSDKNAAVYKTKGDPWENPIISELHNQNKLIYESMKEILIKLSKRDELADELRSVQMDVAKEQREYFKILIEKEKNIEKEKQQKANQPIMSPTRYPLT